MDVWRDIRLKARQRHREASVSNGLTPAAVIVASGLRLARLQVDRFEPGVRYGAGVLGVLEREDGFVRLASTLAPEMAAVVAAHELGHNWLHDDTAFMIRDVEAGFGGSPVETGADRVVAYSPRQRLEVQADVFAQEFLLPADRLRERLVAGERPAAIATELGLPVAFVRMQAIRALLLPPLVPPDVEEQRGAAPRRTRSSGKRPSGITGRSSSTRVPARERPGRSSRGSSISSMARRPRPRSWR